MQQLIRYILVPTDFSQESAAALKVAAEIARRTDAHILLLHVVDSLLYQSIWAIDEINLLNINLSDKKSTITQITNELKTKLIHFAAKYAGDRLVEPCIAFQNIYTAIHEYAKKYENCLIVMGSKGTGETSFLMGSNTEKIIRASPSPVLVVKGAVTNFTNVELKMICIASDFEPHHIPWVIITFIKFLQVIFSAHLQLLKIITPQHFELSSHTQKSLKEFAAMYELQNFSINISNHYTEHEGILAFAEDNQTDLICMTTNGSTGFIQVMMGSIAEEVANQAKIPVLTFRV
jgi:nucleotide-binding universal stress UspA family protein